MGDRVAIDVARAADEHDGRQFLDVLVLLSGGGLARRPRDRGAQAEADRGNEQRLVVLPEFLDLTREDAREVFPHHVDAGGRDRIADQPAGRLLGPEHQHHRRAGVVEVEHVPSHLVHARRRLHALVGDSRKRRHHLRLRHDVERHRGPGRHRDHAIGKALGGGKDVVGEEDGIAGDIVGDLARRFTLGDLAGRLAIGHGRLDHHGLVLEARFRAHAQWRAGRAVHEFGRAQYVAAAGDAPGRPDGHPGGVAHHRDLLGPDVAPLHHDPVGRGPAVVRRGLGHGRSTTEQQGDEHGEPRTMAKDCTHLLRISAPEWP